MPHIEVIQPDQATDELKEIYEGLEKSRGKVAEVHKIQSLNPKSITGHMDLYMTIMFGKSPLKRVQREMMAVVVSKANECEYFLVAVLRHWLPRRTHRLQPNRYSPKSPPDSCCSYRRCS